MSPLPKLQLSHAVVRLASVVFPPLLAGVMWSTTKRTPSATVAPQYAHLKESLLNILNLSRRLASLVSSEPMRLCGFFAPRGAGGRPAAERAFAHDPNARRYAFSPGKYCEDSINRFPGLCPSNSEASRSRCSKNSLDLYKSMTQLYGGFCDFVKKYLRLQSANGGILVY